MRLVIAAFIAAVSITSVVDAKTLRWTSQGDILTFDPMAQNESLNNTANSYIYERLVPYNKQFVPEPALATAWTRFADAVALQPAQEREVPRRHADDGRRRRVLVRARAEARVEHEGLRAGHQGDEKDRRLHRRSSPMDRTRCCCVASSRCRS